MNEGNGGNGCCAFEATRKKYGKPEGGNGGNGGSVFIKADPKLSTFSPISMIKAEDGGSGMSNHKTGKCGEDVYFHVPVGTVVKELKAEKTFELEEHDTVNLRLIKDCKWSN